MDKPKQYIQGWVEFYKLKFKVTPDVLIPRPETELLVDKVLNFLQTTNYKLPTIIDIGTGAGNIVISIAKNISHLGGVTFIATDVSTQALEVARQNAKLQGVEDRIEFLQSDLLTVIPSKEGIQNNWIPDQVRDDNLIIVTNLPYIPTERINYLDSSVKDFEPHVALDGGEDGFELYRKLFAQIKEKGWKPKLIIGEIDYTHGEIALNEARKYFPEAQVEARTDLAHKQRILYVTFSN